MKKLYGDFTKDDWLRVSKMSEDEVPHTIILHGEDGNVDKNIAEWEPVFESVLCRPRWNMFIGQKSKRRIGFVNVICEVLISQPKKIQEFYEKNLPEGIRNKIAERDS